MPAAEPRLRACFESGKGYLGAAPLALSIGALIDARERAFDVAATMTNGREQLQRLRMLGLPRQQHTKHPLRASAIAALKSRSPD